MFEQVATRLLEGAFICSSTAPEAFRWLSNDGHRQDLSAYLERLGRRLCQTHNGQAWYLAWQRVGADERQEVKRLFAGIKQQIRPLVEFITLCMEAERKDVTPAPGDRLEYPTLLKAIHDRADLFEALRQFGKLGKEFTVSEATAQAMLGKVFKQMESWGYLVLINRELESYRFTGKLDYYYEVIDFLVENEGVADNSGEEDDTPTTGVLL